MTLKQSDFGGGGGSGGGGGGGGGWGGGGAFVRGKMGSENSPSYRDWRGYTG